jgi:hypothetical protein
VPPDSEPPPAPAATAFADLLRRAGLGKSSIIRVTGRAGLAALLWFCRHGYEQVGYARQGPSSSDDGDLVLAPQTYDLDALAAMLRTGPRPRAGGVLIVQTLSPANAAPDSIDPAQELLIRSGYQVERCLRGRHRELHVARRRPDALHQRAA